MSKISPLQTLMVYDATHFSVVEGANYGDALSFSDDILLDDIYALSQNAHPSRLSIGTRDGTSHFAVTVETECGDPGSDLYLDCALTLMAPDGNTFDILVFVEVIDGIIANIFFHPLFAMQTNTPYRMVGMDTENPMARMAEVACVSFIRGTHITMSSGAQVKVEHLKPGDKVLTRNAGAQSVRWIGQNTVRAIGDFAPVVISKGTLNNENDLMISPDHRLFIYQRSDAVGAGRPEILVKARHLIDGVQVTQIKGGFVDYFQILFDDHQIIYAEGIAAESMLMDGRTKAVLPGDVENIMPMHDTLRHNGLELSEAQLQGSMAARLKAASAR